METQTNGNAAIVKKASKLTRILKSREGKNVADADKKKASDAFKKAAKAVLAAEATYKSAKEALGNASEAMVMAFGTASITVEGVTYEPTCRGESLFYKQMGQKENVEV